MSSEQTEPQDEVYQYLVVDSGPIIRRTALTSLWRKARKFYTVPAVLQEIRDAKARQHLESLPFDLVTREPSPEGIRAIVDFSRKTGDHLSLSSVDLQVLGLLYDLEREGCAGDMSHVRSTPKRNVGVGRIESLGGHNSSQEPASVVSSIAEEDYDVVEDGSENSESDEEDDIQLGDMQNMVADELDEGGKQAPHHPVAPTKPFSWAMLVNPSLASSRNHQILQSEGPSSSIAKQTIKSSFGEMSISKEPAITSGDIGGQFSDAEDDGDNSGSDFDPEKEISDEECDVYVRDPEELQDEKVPLANKLGSLEQDLQSEFPSLAASRLVPYEGSDDEAVDEEEAKRKADEERKLKSLQPISKSGKLYNSFRNYGDLMKPKPVKKKEKALLKEVVEENTGDKDERGLETEKNESRIIGGTSLAGQGIDVEDDGEGWITSTKDIRTMKAAGALDPKRNPHNLGINAHQPELSGPAIGQRAACATTDFAMQNVILQMNLELLSVDGMKVRKLKTWVTRCGACFKVYTSSENVGPLGTKRLFCERCGSDMMQRIAASVDGKTGRLRLHLSKKYRHNLRGTKFSLPKPGTGNRFKGDLLLREDQLLMGAWRQKVKMASGGKARKAAESIFGADIASNVGCNANSMNSEIRVGFGRSNPNAVKGRERRGKKKKSSDKACGLRRY